MERERMGAANHGDGEAPDLPKLQERLLGAKLRRGLSIFKRGGPCTPVCPWKLEEDVDEAGSSRVYDWAETAAEAGQNGARSKQRRGHQISFAFPAAAAGGGAGSAVSARQLGASLWEMQDLPRYRMRRRSARARRHGGEKVAKQPGFSPLGHHEEVAASSQACWLGVKGRSRYSRKMSTELLKVLNQIWSLEEQHRATVSVAGALMLELEHARSRIQELLLEKQSNQEEIDCLMKQILEDNLAMKSMEKEKVKAAVQSHRDELFEGGRRSRRHSKSLYGRLVKELSEIKSALSNTMDDFERERKTHNLLEDLCDEFANSIIEYEQEVRELKQNSEGAYHRGASLILHLSEAWLLARPQIKLAESQGDLSEKKKIIDRLECEVGAFLQARRSCSSNGDNLVQKDSMKDRCLRRHSLESVRLSGAVSAPQYAEDEDSVVSDLHCFELNVNAGLAERYGHLKHNGLQRVEKLDGNSDVRKMTLGTFKRSKHQGFSGSQMKHDGHAQSCKEANRQYMDMVPVTSRHNMRVDGNNADQADVVLHQILEEGEA